MPTPSGFSPQSKAEFQTAVDECLELSPGGDCSKGPRGAIGEWDVSRVTDMSRMFAYANIFNGDISTWDVSSVRDMSGMFVSAALFNCDIRQWHVSSVTDMSSMFWGDLAFTGDLSKWDVSGVENMHRMFFISGFASDISKWDASSVKSMYGMFWGAKAFNGDLSKWDVSSAKTMDGMFNGAESFDQEICGKTWVDSTASKKLMFTGSYGSISETSCTPAPTPAPTLAITQAKRSFLSEQSTSSVFSPRSRDELKSAVDEYLEISPQGDGDHGEYGPIGEWDVSRVTDMSYMFFRAKLFNGDISKWDVSSVTDMEAMFYNAAAFNGDLSSWDVSNVKKMFGMFNSAAAFNGDLSDWDVSSVEVMFAMFSNTAAFNSDLSQWEVSNVKDMGRMFFKAAAFNGDISEWDVSNVNDMKHMFFKASSYNKELIGDAWVYSNAEKVDMFGGSSGSIFTQGPTTTEDTYIYDRRRMPLPDRELIVRTPTSTILSKTRCSKCGRFAKSGRVSCCAPGGEWYKNCGGASNTNVHHKWHEGIEACKRKTVIQHRSANDILLLFFLCVNQCPHQKHH